VIAVRRFCSIPWIRQAVGRQAFGLLQQRQVHAQRSQHLAEVVVQFARDVGALFLANGLQGRRQLAQLVVRAGQLFLHVLALGDVAHDHGVERGAAVRARDRTFDREAAAVGAHAGDRVVGRAAAGAAVAGAEIVGGLGAEHGHAFDVAAQRAADHVFDAGAEQLGGGGVGHDHGVGRVRRDDGFVGVVDDLAVGLHGFQLLLGAPGQRAADSQAEQKTGCGPGCGPAGWTGAARRVHR
jgi:hypothetical protein